MNTDHNEVMQEYLYGPPDPASNILPQSALHDWLSIYYIIKCRL